MPTLTTCSHSILTFYTRHRRPSGSVARHSVVQPRASRRGWTPAAATHDVMERHFGRFVTFYISALETLLLTYLLTLPSIFCYHTSCTWSTHR